MAVKAIETAYTTVKFNGVEAHVWHDGRQFPFVLTFNEKNWVATTMEDGRDFVAALSTAVEKERQ